MMLYKHVHAVIRDRVSVRGHQVRIRRGAGANTALP